MGQEGLRGWIGEYFAQGMDEVWAIFQDRRHARDRDGGWQLEGMLRLQDGDHLTIYALDGSVLWSGELRARGGRWGLGRRRSPGQSVWHPAQVTAERWRGWLRHQPPLEAELRRPAGAGSGEPDT